MKRLKLLANELGYRSTTSWCLDKKLPYQNLMALRGRRNRPETIKRLAERLEVNSDDLASTMKFEYLLKVISDFELTVPELEEVFLGIVKK